MNRLFMPRETFGLPSARIWTLSTHAADFGTPLHRTDCHPASDDWPKECLGNRVHHPPAVDAVITNRVGEIRGSCLSSMRYVPSRCEDVARKCCIGAFEAVTKFAYRVLETTLLTLLIQKRKQVTFQYLIGLYSSVSIRSRYRVGLDTLSASHADK